MSDLRVVGIDPGLRSTGVAELIYDGHRCVTIGTRLEVTHPPAKPSDEQTAARMTRQIRAVAPAGARSTCPSCSAVETPAPDGLTLVVLEALAPHAKDNNADTTAGYWWRLRSILASRGMLVATVNPGTLKVWATGHGRASDAQMSMALGRMWPGLMIQSDHEVDGALLALMGGQYLGWFTGGEPLRQAEHLAKVAWPRELERVAP